MAGWRIGWLKWDTTSFLQIKRLLAEVGAEFVDARPAWREIQRRWQVKAARDFARAQTRVPQHTRYARRKARGAGPHRPLVVTGTAREAITQPRTVEMEPLELLIGVETHGSFGRFTDVGYLEALQARFGIWRRLTGVETAEWGMVAAEEIRSQVEAVMARHRAA